MPKSSQFIQWFEHIDKDDAHIVGGKGANLGEMTQAGFPVPPGFAVTSRAYYKFIRDNNLTTKIKHLLGTANFDKPESLLQVSSHIKKLIMEGDVHDDIAKEIIAAYSNLSGVLTDALVAVRSSATAEDLPSASFAGQQETFLNVKGEANLLLKVKAAWASLFEARAIFYRHEQKFDHFRIGIAIIVQKMVNADSSGIMFTIDPVTNDNTKIVIEAIHGLGELIVQGQVTPDHYEVDKKEGNILEKTVSPQAVKLEKHGTKNKLIHLSSKEAKKQKITDALILALAQLGKKLEKHYYFPQDSEWAIEKGEIYIVQTRAVTTTQTKKQTVLTNSEKLPILLKGAPASPGIASGPR